MRRQPVAFALIDAAFLADSKWRHLRRRLPEPRDFNSAVGAWLVILTAARRNGLPDLDIHEEAEDSTFITDLIAVGLLTEAGMPDKPFRSWAPARAKYPSDLAPSAPKATNTPFPPLDSASTPFSSTQLPSKEQDARANEDRDALDRFYELTGWNPWTLDWRREELVALQNDYGIPATIAALDAEWNANHDRKGLTKGAAARLARDADRAKEAARGERKQKPRIVVDDAERARVAAELGRPA